MAQDPVPRARASATRRAGPVAPATAAKRARDDAVPAPARDVAAVNHAHYLAVLALGAFALPALATMLERLGAPRTPAGVSALLLAVVLIVAILVDRPREPGPATGETLARSLPARDEGGDDGARL